MRTLLMIMILATAVSETKAQFFIDDFEDGSATDGMPVTWIVDQPFGGGSRVVQNGSYVLTPDAVNDYPNAQFSEIDVVAEGLTFGQVSLKSVVRSSAFENSILIGVVGRSTTNDAGQQNAGVWGALHPGGRITLGVFNVEQNSDQTWDGRYGPTTSSLVTTDVNIQLDIFEDSASLTAWEVGTPRPLTPQVFVSDLPDYVPSTGRVGMWTGQDLVQPMASVAFRSFEATVVPEPSTFGLLSLGAVGPLLRRRQRISRPTN